MICFTALHPNVCIYFYNYSYSLHRLFDDLKRKYGHDSKRLRGRMEKLEREAYWLKAQQSDAKRELKLLQDENSNLKKLYRYVYLIDHKHAIQPYNSSIIFHFDTKNCLYSCEPARQGIGES